MVDTTGSNKQIIPIEVQTNAKSAMKEIDDLSKSCQKLLGLLKQNPNSSHYGFSNFVDAMNGKKGSVGYGQKDQAKWFGQLDKAVASLSKSVDKSAKAFESQNKALDKNKEKIKENKEELTQWDKVLEELTGNWSRRAGIFMSYRLLAGITNVIEGSLASVYNLQKEFANIQAITASSDSEIAKLSGTILDLGTNTRYATEELAKATVTLGQAGLNAEQIESVLQSVSELATATGTDLSTSVDIMTSAMGAWNKTAKESADIADTLVVAANKTKAELSTMGNAIKYAGVAAADLGVSFEEFVAIASAVTDVGLKGTNVGTGLRSVITELANPTKKLEKVFTRLGVSLEEVDIRSRGLQSVLQTLKDAGLGAQEAAEGFDRRAATFYLAATAQLDSVKSLREAFLEEGAAMRANETQMNTLAAQMERFVNTVKRDMYGAFKPILTVLTGVLKVINEIFNVPVLGKFTGRLLVLATTFKSLTVVVTGLATAYKKYADAHKKQQTLAIKSILQTKLLHAGYIRLAAGVRKANLALRAFRLTMGSLLTGLIVTGIGYLIEAIAKSSSSLEDLTIKSVEQHEEINSLATAYQELTEKGILYSKDTDALAIRVQELNKQFKLQGDELISLSAKYDEVLKKMLEVRQARFDEKTKTDKERADALRGKYNNTRRNLNPFDSPLVSNPFQPDEITDTQWLFDRLVAANEEEFKKVKDFINSDSDKYGYKKKLIELTNDVLEYQKLMEGVEAATKITTEDAAEIQNIIVESTLKTNKALESYRKNLQDTLGSESKFSMDELYGVAKTQLDALRKEEDVLSKQIEKMDSSGVSKINPTYISAKEQMSSIEKTITSIEENINENAKEIVKGSLAQAENSIKNITKLLNTAKTSQPDDKLLKQAEDVRNTLIEAVSENAKREIESVTYKEGSYLYNREVARIQQNRDAMIAQYTESLDKATFNYLHNIEKIINELRLATQEAELSKSRIERSDNAVYGGRSALLSKTGGLASTFLVGDSVFSSMLNNASGGVDYSKQKSTVRSSSLERTDELWKLQDVLNETDANKESLTLAKEKLQTELETTTSLTEQERIKEKINELDRQLKEANTAENVLTNQMDSLTSDIKSLQLMDSYLTDLENIKQKWTSLGVGVGKGMFAALGDDIKDLQSFDKTMEAIGAKGFTTFVDNFTDAVTQFANSEKSFSDALKEFVTNSLKDIGNWLIQLGIKAAIYAALQAAFPGFFATLQGFGLVGQVGAQTVNTGAQVAQTKAAGGMIRGGVANRDSVNARLMPGEYVLKKSAVDYLGENFLNSLNHNTEQTLNAITPEVGVMGENGGQSVVNVWVVSKEEQAGMGPNDVIATITKDIRTGGTTRQLIKSVIAGRK